MLASIVLLAASAILSLAETVKLLGVGEEDSNVLVSSLGSDATATTWLLGCPITMSNDDDCLFSQAVKYTIGPSTARFSSAQPDLTLEYACKLASTTSAVCEVHYTGPAAAASDFYLKTTSTVTITGTDLATNFVDATIVTDSASILNAAAAFTTPSATTTEGNPPVTSGPGVTSAPTTTPLGSTSSGSESVESTTSTGGIPHITGSCGWSVGGIAAAAALAML